MPLRIEGDQVPDSGWLEKVGKAPTRIVLGVGVSTGAVWAGPFDLSDPKWLGPTLALLCIGAWTIIGCQIGSWGIQRLRDWASNRIYRAFGALAPNQKTFLRNVYQTGKREFTIQNETAKQRWFEELRLANYVEDGHASWVDPVTTYTVTESGWEELERALPDTDRSV